VIPKLSEFADLKDIPKLPDPFKMLDGSAITTKDQWTCRRAEISAQLQKYELGVKPPKPESVTGAFSGGKLTVTVKAGSKTMSFTASITAPSGTGPYPAMIGLAGGSLPASSVTGLGVAMINFNNDDMGAQTNAESSRGKGKFFDFVGADDGAGDMVAWAWGVSRIIDALEVTPDAKIDTKHLGVTGCSRNGKGALMIGALDSRIALTVPQESGAGGAAAWRVSEVDNGNPGKVQTLSTTASEQVWLRKDVTQFNGKNVTKLPIDHHEVLAMVAPRGLFVVGNPQYDWLGVNSTDQSAAAAQLVYEALGAKDNIALVESSHAHCSYASSEVAPLEAFIKKFLLGKTDTATQYWISKNKFDAAKWVDWMSPALK
jgi:hypothetical protein